MAGEAYTDSERGAILATVDSEGGTRPAARVLGLPSSSVHEIVTQAREGRDCGAGDADRTAFKRRARPHLVEAALQALTRIPEKLDACSAPQLAMVAGICIDKLAILDQDAPPPSAADLDAEAEAILQAGARQALARLAASGAVTVKRTVDEITLSPQDDT